MAKSKAKTIFCEESRKFSYATVVYVYAVIPTVVFKQIPRVWYPKYSEGI